MASEHAYTLDPTKSDWTNNAVQDQGNELTRKSSGNTVPQSTQLAGPLWTDPGIKSGIGRGKIQDIRMKCAMKILSVFFSAENEASILEENWNTKLSNLIRSIKQ